MSNTPFNPIPATPDEIVEYVQSLTDKKLATNLIMAFLKMKQMQIHVDLLDQRAKNSMEIYEKKMLGLLEQETINKYYQAINSKS